jgi:MFS family permease
MTVQVLFAQEVLELSSAGYGMVLSAAALGAISGSLLAPQCIRLFGVQMCLFISVAVWGIFYAVIGVTNSGLIMAVSLYAVMAGAMLWNVITVSWRQRRIPSELLGRVNSIYRFFGWGSMPLGALAGGLVVTLLEDDLGREMAVRAPFILAGIGCAGLLIYAIFRLRLD